MRIFFGRCIIKNDKFFFRDRHVYGPKKNRRIPSPPPVKKCTEYMKKKVKIESGDTKLLLVNLENALESPIIKTIVKDLGLDTLDPVEKLDKDWKHFQCSFCIEIFVRKDAFYEHIYNNHHPAIIINGTTYEDLCRIFGTTYPLGDENNFIEFYELDFYCNDYRGAFGHHWLGGPEGEK